MAKQLTVRRFYPDADGNYKEVTEMTESEREAMRNSISEKLGKAVEDEIRRDRAFGHWMLEKGYIHN